jgi:Zn-dependent protease with chaperone function
VLLLLVEIGMFLVAPVANAFSRMQEHAADVYGLEVVHGIVPDSSEVAARSFQVLGEVDLADPNPPEFIRFWLYSHPPLADRLSFAYNYDPWSNGESPKYVK